MTKANCDQRGEDEGLSQEEPNGCTIQNTKHLSPDQMSLLQSQGYEGMLDDEIINTAQDLLQRQFPNSDGLQPVVAVLVPGYKVTKNAVQIHHGGERMHWLTNSYRNSKIMVADSIRTDNLSPYIRDQRTNLYSGVVHEPLKHMHFQDVDHQKNNYDCRVFAIAFAYELLSEDGDPEVTDNHKAIRGHLITCLHNGSINKSPIKE
ncbi:uncharacterized protein LOC130289638 [Hyla sarda]|uniref:uncharacterized protein LOC130289638 n=1 Tax=Hyla sarda TaxID=327740 RepID=UPI0024C2917C|nr:uncharacterized protein LOC130289638 [Hyla sarda]